MNRRETTYLLTTDIIDASIHITCTALRHSRCINKSIIFKIYYMSQTFPNNTRLDVECDNLLE